MKSETVDGMVGVPREKEEKKKKDRMEDTVPKFVDLEEVQIDE